MKNIGDNYNTQSQGTQTLVKGKKNPDKTSLPGYITLEILSLT